MRTLILFILSLPLLAQVHPSSDIAVLMGGKRGLTRSGLAAGVQTGSTNLLLNSETMKTGWTAANVAVSENTADVAAPDGTNTAEKLTFTGDPSARIFQGLYTPTTSALVYTSEVWLRTASSSITLRLYGQGSAEIPYCEITVTSEWKKFSCSKTTADQSTYFLLKDLAGVGSSFVVYAWHPQYNLGSPALPYVATTDLQSIASVPPGTSTITRGANTGASSDDPTVSLAGWTFDSGDRVSGLPAKGSSWTTTNCSGEECYTIDSAGNQYVNGVPRRNLLRWSEPTAKTQLAASGGAATAFTESMCGYSTGIAMAVIDFAMAAYWTTETLVNGQQYTISAVVKRDDGGVVTVGVGTSDVTTQLALVIGGNNTQTNTVTDLGGGCYLVTGTNPTSTTYSTNRAGVLSYMQMDRKAYKISRLMTNLGSTALPYQKTTDSREWALETVGNYTGLLTWWGRWNRVLSPGEVLRNYRQWIRPQVNARGNTLP